MTGTNGTMAGRKTVAITGMSPASRDIANYEPDHVEVWGLNNAREILKRVDRLFQIHQRIEVDEDPEYLKWLQSLDCPVYMIEHYDDIPNSVKYPFGEVATQIFPAETEYASDYLTSTIAYMMALAIYEGFDEIHLWGIDMATGTEYEQQRPCMEFWIGAARMKGIKVVIPDSSPLCKHNPDGMYGVYRTHRLTSAILKETLGNLERQRIRTPREDEATHHTINGARQITRKLIDIADPSMKGKRIEFDFIDQPTIPEQVRRRKAAANGGAPHGS